MLGRSTSVYLAKVGKHIDLARIASVSDASSARSPGAASVNAVASRPPSSTETKFTDSKRGATDTEADLRQRLQADLEYLDGWTILRDLRKIFGTMRVLVHHRAF